MERATFPDHRPRRPHEGLRRLLIASAVGVGLLGVLWQRCGLRGCPDVEGLSGFVPDEASVVLDRRGREVAKLYRIRRTIVPLDSLPGYVPAAFVAVEDHRFWRHGGIDWRRVPAALWANLRAGDIEEGFSTITMQLARNVFPDRLPMHERTVWRKLAEMRVARAIEDRFSKRDILELYLNQIYFGSGAWGIDAAAREYFGKPATRLQLAEAALLAGLPLAPSRLNPRVDREAALARRRLVLAEMVEHDLIDTKRAARAAHAPLRLARDEADARERAPYFVEEVRRRLEQELGESLYTDGLVIRTTLDLGIQDVAEEELRRQLVAIEAGRHGWFPHARDRRRAVTAGRGDDDAGEPTRYLQGAVVVMDARTGDVLALVGGRDFEDSKFNRATQARRQPGSAFKPIVYAAALAAGFPATHRLLDEPTRFVQADGRVWEPENYEGSYGGVVTLRDALVHSRNVATAHLAQQLGMAAVVDMARRLGLRGEIPEYPAVALGAAEVSLLELTGAYAAFATLGRLPEPRLIARVSDRDGKDLWRQPRSVRRVLEPEVAFLVTDLLRDVVERGTGTPVRHAGFSAPAAGKTGTTNRNTDAWFIGFTPRLVAGVWVGFDRPRTIVPGGTGGRLAAPVWGRMFRRIAPRNGGWRVPAGLEARVVDAFGMVVPEGCLADAPVRQEYFLAGTAPDGTCWGVGKYGWADSLAPLDTLGTPDWPDAAEQRAWWDSAPPASPDTAGARP